ncbi:hypothetical protein [Pseudaeromonas paramecii]|uniref:STAS/SEC14 domain-containing protein n=1 Tax=Pseudaeromonas paramecii TaxID=2138166 RepID=A0ABP8QH47_9GAMM
MIPAPNQLQHGFYSIECHGDFLRICVAESTNEELVLAYQREVKQAIGQLTSRHWGVHLIVLGDAMMTQDAAERLITATRAQVPLGRCCTAIELRQPTARALQTHFWEGIYRQAGLHCAVLANETAALEWIRQQIRQADQADDGFSKNTTSPP